MIYKPSIDFFKETWFAQLVLIAIAVALIWFFKWSFNQEVLPGWLPNEASVVLNIKDEERTFRGGIVEEMTALDAVNAAAEAGGINFLYGIGENGLVEFAAIGDYKTPDTPFLFLLNDRKIDFKELNKTNIKAGDVLKIKI